MERRTRKSVDELLLAERYTPQQLAELLEIGTHVVFNAAYEGELPALIVGHDIVNVDRDDAVTWFNARYGRDESSSRDTQPG